MSGISLMSLLWWLAIGFLFYWMMKKGGCGAHGHTGHRKNHDDPKGKHPSSRKSAAATKPATKITKGQDEARPTD